MLIRNLKGGYTIWYRDVLRIVRDRARIVAALWQRLLYVFVFGTGLAPATSGTAAGRVLDFRQFMFPRILAMVVLFTAIVTAISVVRDCQFGFLREVMVVPVSRTPVALGSFAILAPAVWKFGRRD
jgi:ABC-2 type transport system permease protein